MPAVTQIDHVNLWSRFTLQTLQPSQARSIPESFYCLDWIVFLAPSVENVILMLRKVKL
jgi:hypothetical protein